MIVIQIIAWVLLIILGIVGLLVVLLMAGVFDPPEKRGEFCIVLKKVDRFR